MSLLGNKKNAPHEVWQDAWLTAQASPDPERAERILGEAVDRVHAFRSENPEERIAYGWSGGKDSLALQLVAEAAGIQEGVLVLSHLEVPSFEREALQRKPSGVVLHRREGINHGWLREHMELLFPDDAATAGRWFQLIQHRGQREFMRTSGSGALLMGRRRADGNYVGKALPGGGHAYRDREGFLRFSPISDWSHDDLLNLLAVRGIQLPSINSARDGFQGGTGAWAARRRAGTVEETWDLTYQLDPEAVHIAAREGIPGANSALERGEG